MMLPAVLCLFIATATATMNSTINTTTAATNASLTTLTQAFTTNASSALLTQDFTTNSTLVAPLAAPLYRNVTTGEAWVYPSSANDLGARDMSCECFDPGGESCISFREYRWLREDGGRGRLEEDEWKKETGLMWKNQLRPMLHANLHVLGALLRADRIDLLRQHVLRAGRVVLWGVLLS